MTRYEEFQKIMNEINFKKQMQNSKDFTKNYDLPPGFEDLFGFNKK